MRITIFIILISILLPCLAFSSQLKIVPSPESGLSKADLRDAKITITGAASLSGTLDASGVLVTSGGGAVDLKPGEYSLSLSLTGYDTYKTTFTVEAPPAGMPALNISREVTLKKTVTPVGGGGTGTVGGSSIGSKGFWNWFTVVLIFIIAMLILAIVIVVKRRSPAHVGGAAAPPSRAAKPVGVSKGKVTEIATAHEEDPVVPRGERFTGKRFGRYIITRKIAQGGMAHVLEAEFEKGEKAYKAALKIPYENYQEDAEFINRFNQEAKLGDILFHENIIQIYEYGTTKSGVKFIAMEYIDGTDLRKVLTGSKKIKPTRAAEIAMDIAKALDYAHGQNPPVYHRDVKPENILFRDKEGRSPAILTDFGIATQGGTMGTGKALIGTALYSCPDGARGYPVGPSYDIYSLGVVFYEMLTGNVPFTGADYYTIMRRHEEERPTPPGEVVSGTPADLDAIVMKMLEKDPKNRYQSAKELLVLLRDFLTR